MSQVRLYSLALVFLSALMFLPLFGVTGHDKLIVKTPTRQQFSEAVYQPVVDKLNDWYFDPIAYQVRAPTTGALPALGFKLAVWLKMPQPIISATVWSVTFFSSAIPVEARTGHGGFIPINQPTTCPDPITTYDGCADAHLDAQFQDPNLIANYARDGNGNPITVYHNPEGTFNPAGIAFPVGMYGVYKTAANRLDPISMTVTGTATVTGGNTMTWTSLTAGSTPQVGMVIFNADPNNRDLVWYPNHVKIAAPGCTGTIPTLVCPLDQSGQQNHANFVAGGSFWAPCLAVAGIGSNKTSVNCTFQGSANGWTGTIIGAELGPVGGHNATTVTAQSRNDGASSGTLVIQNSHCLLDAFNMDGTTGNCIAQVSPSPLNINLEVDDTECDGGNVGTDVNGPYTITGTAACINWKPESATSSPHETVKLSRLYIHDWVVNPITVATGWVDYTEQSSVYIRTSMNCGNAAYNICHGAPAQFGTSRPGRSTIMKIWNRTVAYIYGSLFQKTPTIEQHQGVTSPFAGLGGVGSALQESYDVQGGVIICNAMVYSGGPNAANCGPLTDPFRIGSVPSYKVQHVFFNSVGITSCGGIGGDLGPGVSSSASDTSNGTNPATSTWNSSGWALGNAIYYPGQYLVRGVGSQSTLFRGTLTDNGNGTSTLNITQTIVGTTTNLTNSGAITPQIIGLYLSDLQAHPTLILSGSGTTYIVGDGSGSGETRAAQTFGVGQIIMPFGQGGTTAVGGTSYAGYSGTVMLGGNNFSVSPADNNWTSSPAAPGNLATIATDVTDLEAIDVSGAAGIAGPPDGPGMNPGTHVATVGANGYCSATGIAY